MAEQPIPFGKYLLLERVNVGGMAEVFKAKAFGVEGFERLVAVKRILPAIAADTDFITMFIDEAKISVQLTHANIAQIFDLGKVDDSYFIALEYVAGKDLRGCFDRMRKRGETMPLSMACYVIMKVCEGLDYAHNKRDPSGRDLNLVHRDVSPQNILLSYDGEVKLIDFGIAKTAGKIGTTQAGMLKGKFGYMSPEQVLGLPIDRRSDIFAVGILLYELLTGERLFVGESDFATLEKIKNADVIPPSTYNPRIPDELERIVMRALAKEMGTRYQTAMDLHDDLQSFVYTSGSFFARKDLSLRMQELFAEEITREKARDEVYQRIERPPLGDEQPTPAIDLVHVKARMTRSYGTVAVTPPTPPPRPGLVVQGASPSTSEAVTGAAMWQAARTEVDPPSGVKVDWDDEEMSTEVYDKPGQLKLPPTMPEPRASEARAAEARASAPPLSGPAAGPMGAAIGLSGSIPPVPRSSVPPPPPVRSSTPPPVAVASSRPPPPPRSLGSSAPPPALLGTPAPTAPPVVPQAVTMGAPSVPAPEAMPTSPGPVTEPAGTLETLRGRVGWSLERTLAVGGIGCLAVVALVVVGVVWLLRPSVGSITFETDPPQVTILVDGRDVHAQTSGQHRVDNLTEGSHTLEIRAPGHVTRTETFVVEGEGVAAMGRVVLEKEAPLAARGTGFSLRTKPAGARVRVDDLEVAGATPVTVTRLAPGPHTVEVRHDGNYAPYRTQVNLVAGEILELPELVLQQNSVTASFESDPPGAEVALVRGDIREPVGRAPARANVEIWRGAWTVEMRLPGHHTWVEALVVPPGEDRVTIRARLLPTGVARSDAGVTELPGEEPARRPTPRPVRPVDRAEPEPRPTQDPAPKEPRRPAPEAEGYGTLAINSRPWSQVYVDARLVGNTPQPSIRLRAGEHRVTLVNPDFNVKQTFTVTIEADKRLMRIVELTP